MDMLAYNHSNQPTSVPETLKTVTYVNGQVQWGQAPHATGPILSTSFGGMLGDDSFAQPTPMSVGNETMALGLGGEEYQSSIALLRTPPEAYQNNPAIFGEDGSLNTSALNNSDPLMSSALGASGASVFAQGDIVSMEESAKLESALENVLACGLLSSQ